MLNKVAEVSRMNPLFDTRPVLCKQHSTFRVNPPSGAALNRNQNYPDLVRGAEKSSFLKIIGLGCAVTNALGHWWLKSADMRPILHA